MIQTAISAILLTLGAILMLLASVGILRMPDVFLRMSASTKAATLGVVFIMLAVALHFNNLGITGRALGVIIFIILTGPVSAHMIARAAYITGEQLWSETKIDELQGRYNQETHTLDSQPSEAIKPN
jgi:multicomponent Na+:H+ antiporter subunit G